MNFTVLLFVSLFSGLILAKDVGTATEKGKVMETRQDSENQVLQLRNKEGTKVIFTATTGGRCNHIRPFNTDNTTLIYQTVIRNNGHAYSPSTGIFAAPVAGVYYFAIFLYTSGGDTTALSLYKNDLQMLMTHNFPSNPSEADNEGNTVFLHLKRGDQVYVRMGANRRPPGTYCYTTFSGFLVPQM